MLSAQGRNVVNFAAGELASLPPTGVLAATSEALSHATNRYTDTAGIPALRDAIAARMSVETGTLVDSDRIVVTNGAKYGLYLTVLAVVEQGDEVLVPAPYWGSLVSQVLLAGGRPVAVDTTENDFRLTRELLERHATDRTKAILVNTPNNPTGAVYPAEDLREIADWAAERDVWLVSDECYSSLVHPPARHVSLLSVAPHVQERLVTVNSFSKSFAVTGWRIGYVHAAPAVVDAMKKMQSHTTSHASSVVQHGLVSAAAGAEDAFRADVLVTLARSRSLVADRLGRIPHLRFRFPDGAFYFFVDCRDALGRSHQGRRITDADVLADMLLEHAAVAVVPGSAFGLDGFFRLSYAIDEKDILLGLDRLEGFFADVR
nr:pyridoxal phosphate-dependent aminotransferase [Streptomyces sp. SID3343]